VGFVLSNGINEESTKAKEAFTHAELYCHLREISNTQEKTYNNYQWRPGKVYIEASVKAGSIDLLLEVVNSSTLESRYGFVIEVKRSGRPHRELQHQVVQSYNYAKKIGCPYYSVYDGDNLIVMKKTKPYLIGFGVYHYGYNRLNDIDFTKKFWEIVCGLQIENVSFIPDWSYHPNYSQWKMYLHTIIRQAIQREMKKKKLSVKDEKAISVEANQYLLN
jgi:hypothetical protein